MAYVLSLTPHGPLAAPYQERRYETSWSSLGSSKTVKHHRIRQHSDGSPASTASLYAGSWPPSENEIPMRSISYSGLESGHPLSRQCTPNTKADSGLIHATALSNLAYRNSSPAVPTVQSNREAPTLRESEIAALNLVHEEGVDESEDLDLEEVLSWHTAPKGVVLEDINIALGGKIGDDSNETSKYPFKRWMSTLRRRTAKQHMALRDRHPSALSPPMSPQCTRSPLRHRKSDSWTSSADFVTAVKSASVTLASFSIGSLSRGGTRKSGRSKLWRQSGGSDVRKSVNSDAPSVRSIMDEAARQRSRKRREKLEELIRTEESYLGDLKALSNAYFTLLPPLVPHSAYTRSSARSNVANLIQLHDEILGELHRIVPSSDYNSTAAAETALIPRPAHIRWLSDDGLSPIRPRQDLARAGWSKRRSLDIKRTLGQDTGVIPCAPSVVSEVAKVFARNIKRFTLYEEYGARCEMMQDTVDFFQKTTLAGPDYDKAIEALCASLNPSNTKEANKRKALSLKDLLIKPIQRITRYELLFRDLCKYTPSCDDPSSHLVLDDILYQLGAICHNVNEAKDNPETLRMLESSWLLQDRLLFQDKISRSNLFQRVGRLALCGTLFVAYRIKNQIQGHYMVCIMYESCLMLASAENSTKYNVMVAASLATANIEETDNAKGLQCHTAPYTWKIVFESGGKMFELILAACSAAEERVWRDRMSGRIAVETRNLAQGHAAPGLLSPLTNDLRDIGKAYGKPGGFVRRLSVQRASTLGPHPDPNQVIIKYTDALRDESNNASTASLPIPRSQSVTTPSHVPTLAPMRQARIKLEGMLAEVWTKDAIPFPGMGVRRSEHSIRETANDLMRKLSMASIASNFSKRSMSFTGASGPYQANVKVTKVKKTRPESVKPKRPPLINFQNAPVAFLPEDFELQDTRSRPCRGLNLRTLTMNGYDRPRSPLFFSQENKPPEMPGAKSVPWQDGGEVTLCQDSSMDDTVRGDSASSRQSSHGVFIKPAVPGSEAGKKSRLFKFLGKVRPSDE